MLKRTPLKRGQQPLKRTPLKRVSNVKRETGAIRVEERERDEEIYKEIWRQRLHFCFETDVYLGKEPLKIYFHHVLPKHLYPEYRHEKWNIVLVSRQVHEQLEFSPKDGTKIGALYLELLEKHYNFVQNKNQ